ncbi:MAG: MBL fold metallo-hydrolase [Bacillota bacterium]|nr:MBL fold metallo-hydrolase [Bacillota bacterium]
MNLLYFFDNHLKPFVMKGTKLCNPAPTGVYAEGIRCIRQHDVNLWFYTKGETTIAIDAGHYRVRGAGDFERIGVDPQAIGHLFLTHADVDHAGGIDARADNLYPQARVYLGRKEEPYITGKMHRFRRLGVKIKNCVRIRPGYRLLDDGEVVDAGGIEVRVIDTPGHTYGHVSYLIDHRILFSGDCLAIKEDGGYSFPEFFNQDSELNKRSIRALEEALAGVPLKAVCSGHSGLWIGREDLHRHIFAHRTESAPFSKKQPFDDRAPSDIRR